MAIIHIQSRFNQFCYLWEEIVKLSLNGTTIAIISDVRIKNFYGTFNYCILYITGKPEIVDDSALPIKICKN